MFGLNASLEIARRALQTQQLAMSVIGTNIANVNTPGYSRRRVVFQPGQEIETGWGTVGSGVNIVDIQRVRDKSLDVLFRKHNSNSGKWSGLDSYLSKVEMVLSEPGEDGLNGIMDNFWNAWQDLSMEPENTAVRAQVREYGSELCNYFHSMHSNLRDLQTNLVNEVTASVDEINQISSRLARLNTMVMEGEFGGQTAAGLRDERDQLIDELSNIVDVQIKEEADGSMTIMTGYQVLVHRDNARQIEVTTGLGGTSYSTTLVWEGTERSLSSTGGRLAGYISAKDEYIAGYIDDLNELAAGVVNTVNSAHVSGYGMDGSTGNNFFDPSKTLASNIAIDSAILADLDAIAASGGGLEGDGSGALNIANLRNSMAMRDGSLTLNGFYSNMVGGIGFDAQEAKSFQNSEEYLLLDVDSQRLGISGVSLDEEMTSLMAHQHSYMAMIQVTNTIDEMIVSLINIGA